MRAAAAVQPDRGADRHQPGRDAVELARLLALVNVAMADAGVAIWESKYLYGFWRPVTGIREASPGTGPTGAGDGNPATIGDPTFTPLGAPASNLTGPNFTPPFPAYPSGHAGFGGALFQTLRNFYGTDRIAFTFVSDEFNGVTLDNDGNVRPLRPAQFRIALAGRGGERPEPHLPRHPLVVRQDRGHRAGPAASPTTCSGTRSSRSKRPATKGGVEDAGREECRKEIQCPPAAGVLVRAEQRPRRGCNSCISAYAKL